MTPRRHKQSLLLLLLPVSLLVAGLGLARDSLLTDLVDKKHWKALHNEQGVVICKAKSLDGWLYFGRRSSLDPKYRPDLVKFGEKCNVEKLLNERFERDEARVYENVRAPLAEFLSCAFIEQYIRENRDLEPPMHLKPMGRRAGLTVQGEGESCVPDARSEGASRAAIKRLAQGSSKLATTIQKHRGRSRELKEAVVQYFEINLAATCEIYWQILHYRLFGPLMGAIDKFRDGDWTHISSQSEEFRHGVFRYLFCRRLVNDQPLKSKYFNALAEFASEI